MAKKTNLPAKSDDKAPDKERDASQDSLFREVDEDLRQEKLETFWKQWGTSIIAACVAIVVGVAGWEIWSGLKHSAAETASTEFAAAIADPDLAQRAAALSELAQGAPTGYQLIAGLRRGAIASEQGDVDVATTAFRNASAPIDDPIYSDLSVLLTVIAEMEASAGGDPMALAQQLQPLTETGRPWRYTAKELEAYLTLESGDQDRARELFLALSSDPAAPQGIRTRALNFDRYFASR